MLDHGLGTACRACVDEYRAEVKENRCRRGTRVCKRVRNSASGSWDVMLGMGSRSRDEGLYPMMSWAFQIINE